MSTPKEIVDASILHCSTLSQHADLCNMTAERRSWKHCRCVFQELVPLFEEGQSTFEREILRCPSCRLRVCIDVLSLFLCVILNIHIHCDCVDSMRGKMALSSRITCRRKPARGPSPMFSSVRITCNYSSEMRSHFESVRPTTYWR